MTLSIHGCFGLLGAALLAFAMGACTQTTPPSSTKPSVEAPKPIVATPKPAVETPKPGDTRKAIRISAGSDAEVTDANGVKWAADSGAEDGQTIQRPDLQVTGTKTPEIYHNERYAMTAYSFKVPNGKYKVNLHFSEDYEGNTTADARLFDFAIRDGDSNGKVLSEEKNFGPWKKAGAAAKAYVHSADVTVTKEKISITFVPIAENPQINAIEIVPQ
jgi:hypothetical protein